MLSLFFFFASPCSSIISRAICLHHRQKPQEPVKAVPPPPPKKPAADPAAGGGGGGGGGGDEDSLNELIKKFREGDGDPDVEDLDALYLQMQDERKRRNTAVEDLEKLHKELTTTKLTT